MHQVPSSGLSPGLGAFGPMVAIYGKPDEKNTNSTSLLHRTLAPGTPCLYKPAGRLSLLLSASQKRTSSRKNKVKLRKSPRSTVMEYLFLSAIGFLVGFKIAAHMGKRHTER